MDNLTELCNSSSSPSHSAARLTPFQNAVACKFLENLRTVQGHNGVSALEYIIYSRHWQDIKAPCIRYSIALHRDKWNNKDIFLNTMPTSFTVVSSPFDMWENILTRDRCLANIFTMRKREARMSFSGNKNIILFYRPSRTSEYFSVDKTRWVSFLALERKTITSKLHQACRNETCGKHRGNRY